MACHAPAHYDIAFLKGAPCFSFRSHWIALEISRVEGLACRGRKVRGCTRGAVLSLERQVAAMAYGIGFGRRLENELLSSFRLDFSRRHCVLHAGRMLTGRRGVSDRMNRIFRIILSILLSCPTLGFALDMLLWTMSKVKIESFQGGPTCTPLSSFFLGYYF